MSNRGPLQILDELAQGSGWIAIRCIPQDCEVRGELLGPESCVFDFRSVQPLLYFAPILSRQAVAYESRDPRLRQVERRVHLRKCLPGSIALAERMQKREVISVGIGIGVASCARKQIADRARGVIRDELQTGFAIHAGTRTCVEIRRDCVERLCQLELSNTIEHGSGAVRIVRESDRVVGVWIVKAGIARKYAARFCIVAA